VTRGITSLLLALSLMVPSSAFGRRAVAGENEMAPADRNGFDPDLRVIQTIQFHLDNVAAGTRRTRYLRSGIFLVAPLYLSGVFIAQERLNSGEPLNVAKGVVGLTGLFFGVAGIATLMFPTGAESGAEKYRDLPARNAREAAYKRESGEAQMRAYADSERNSRRLIGGAFLTVGVADLLWYFGTGSNTSLNFLPYLAGFYGTLGAVLLFVSTPAETEHEAYLSARAAASAPKGSVSWGILPSPSGLQAALRWQF
jgi:hypothetical protein